MRFLEIFQDSLSSSFYSVFFFLFSICFQNGQPIPLLLDIAALRDFRVSAFFEARCTHKQLLRAREGDQRTQIRENALRAEKMPFATGQWGARSFEA